MTDFKSDIQCPCCRRRLGTFQTMPENCPRCRTDLTSLRRVWQAALACHQSGVASLRKGDVVQAAAAFQRSFELVHTDTAAQAVRFTKLMMRMKGERPDA